MRKFGAAPVNVPTILLVCKICWIFLCTWCSHCILHDAHCILQSKCQCMRTLARLKN